MMLRVCGGIPLLCKDSRITDMPEGLVCLPVDELLSCCMAVGAVCFWGEEEVLSPLSHDSFYFGKPWLGRPVWDQ